MRFLDATSLSAAAGSSPPWTNRALQASLERLADADLLFVEGAPPQAKYRFKHALIQDAAYESLLKSRRQALHRRAAEASRRKRSAEPEAIAHHFTQAGLDDLAIEWWGKAGDQALRRSAFQEAIAHLGKAIAMADKASGGGRGRRPSRQQRPTQLHVAYGNALIAARATARPKQPKPSQERANRPPATRTRRNVWRPTTAYGPAASCGASFPPMRAHAAAFLSDVEARPDSPEAGVAHRCVGGTRWFAGEYREARDHLGAGARPVPAGPRRRSGLSLWTGRRCRGDALLRAGFWPLGDIVRAISLVGRVRRGSRASPMLPRSRLGRLYLALFELMRGDYVRAAPNAFELARLAGDYELPMLRAFGRFLEGWAKAASGAVGGGLEDMRRGAELLRQQNVLFFDGLLRLGWPRPKPG